MGWIRGVESLGCVALLAAIHMSPARAETAIEGEISAVRLQAHDASIDEILAALHARYGVSYRTRSALTQHVTADFEGPLNRVLARVLGGYDYIIKTTHGTQVDVFVLSTGSPRPVRPPFRSGRSD